MSTNTISSLCSGFVLALLTTLIAPSAVHADEYQDHLARASQLAQNHHYRDALTEFKAAYAIEQVPTLLLSIARLHTQLGDGREALDAYRRFKVAVPSPEPELQKETDAAIASLGAVYEAREPRESRPAADTATSLARLEALLLSNSTRSETDRLRRRNTSLMAGGSVLFGLGYAASFLTGSLSLGLGTCNTRNYDYSSSSSSSTSSNSQCVAANALLLVPVAGPIVSSLVWSTNVAWSIPWTFVDGAAQIGGLTMMILAAKSNHALAAKGALANLRLLPYSTPTQAGLTVAGRF